MGEVANSDHDHILSFTRTVPGETVLAVFNLSAQPRVTPLHGVNGRWRDAMGQPEVTAIDPAEMALPAWGYRLFFQKR